MNIQYLAHNSGGLREFASRWDHDDNALARVAVLCARDAIELDRHHLVAYDEDHEVQGVLAYSLELVETWADILALLKNNLRFPQPLRFRDGDELTESRLDEVLGVRMIHRAELAYLAMIESFHKGTGSLLVQSLQRRRYDGIILDPIDKYAERFFQVNGFRDTGLHDYGGYPIQCWMRSGDY